MTALQDKNRWRNKSSLQKERIINLNSNLSNKSKIKLRWKEKVINQSQNSKENYVLKQKSKSNSLLCLKITQETTLFQRSTAFLIKSIFVLSFLDMQNNKSRLVITILSKITWLLWYLKYKAIASSIFYQKSNINSYRLNLYYFHLI